MGSPAATSSAGDRGGSVREAGTEKTKWRSTVHSEGQQTLHASTQNMRTHTHTHITKPHTYIPLTNTHIMHFGVPSIIFLLVRRPLIQHLDLDTKTQNQSSIPPITVMHKHTSLFKASPTLHGPQSRVGALHTANFV